MARFHELTPFGSPAERQTMSGIQRRPRKLRLDRPSRDLMPSDVSRVLWDDVPRDHPQGKLKLPAYAALDRRDICTSLHVQYTSDSGPQGSMLLAFLRSARAVRVA